MRICHISDSHLGAGENHPKRGPSGLTLRQEDIVRSFSEAIDKIIALKPDVCIHSGDLFDTVRPLNKVMAIAGRELHRLAEGAGIPTILITGNHDAPKQPHVGAAIDVFRQIDNLHIVSGSSLEKFKIGGSSFFALPHCLTTEILKRELSQCVPDPKARFNVLIMHGVAAGMPEFSMADLGEQELPLDVMDRFDYTALGHFHNYCRVAAKAYYSGSTERLSQAERNCAKGFISIDLESFDLKFNEVDCREMVDIEAIDASGKRGDELAAIIREQVERLGPGDKIVRLNVAGISAETLKTIPADILAELKQKSFSLDIRFEREKTREGAEIFGRSAIGRLDEEFKRYLDSIELSESDRDRLFRDGLKYLGENDS
jgi:exonuclease SbcD